MQESAAAATYRTHHLLQPSRTPNTQHVITTCLVCAVEEGDRAAALLRDVDGLVNHCHVLGRVDGIGLELGKDSVPATLKSQSSSSQQRPSLPC